MDSLIKGFLAYIRLEKSLSQNTVLAYRNDLRKFQVYLQKELGGKSALQLDYADLSGFVHHTSKAGASARTQARMISGIRAFYRYLLLEDLIEEDPADLLETPNLSRSLPDTLSVAEIDQILDSVDLSSPFGHRDRAILETLYGCGVRVSELIHIRTFDVNEKRRYLSVTGKGKKERLVPIGSEALKHITLYRDTVRNTIATKKESADILFINRFGNKLSRVAIFNLVKAQVAAAGIHKNISPHTFRHSFASHLVQNGADLRAVQAMLGHESILTTEIYTHLDRVHLRDTILRYHPRELKNQRRKH